MKLLDALELVLSFLPGTAAIERAVRLLRIAVRIVEIVRRARNDDTFNLDQEDRELDLALDELEREEAA